MTMLSERVSIFLDGSNLFHKLRSPELDLPNLLLFNYRGLCDWLARSRRVVSYAYYISVVRATPDDPKGQEMRRGQQRLFAHLMSSNQNFVIQRGYLMKGREDGVFHEKGVDVQLAVDLLVGAYENYFDTAVVVSSDTDLIPAIRKAKQLGKTVEYIGFAHQPSFALERAATLSRLLIKDEIEPFVKRGLI